MVRWSIILFARVTAVCVCVCVCEGGVDGWMEEGGLERSQGHAKCSNDRGTRTLVVESRSPFYISSIDTIGGSKK